LDGFNGYTFGIAAAKQVFIETIWSSVFSKLARGHTYVNVVALLKNGDTIVAIEAVLSMGFSKRLNPNSRTGSNASGNIIYSFLHALFIDG
jgi:hypothetical protein